MLKFFKTMYFNWFGKNNSDCQDVVCQVVKQYTREELMNMLDLDKYPDVEYVREFDKNKPTILIMDDIPDTYALYQIDFNKIKIKYNEDVFTNFNVVKALGAEAGFIAYKYILSGKRLDYAILDITIGSIVKFDNGEFLDLDGVDIGIAVMRHTNAKVLFSTAHTLNRKNMVMEYYITKFEEYCDEDITKFSISKNNDRVLPIHTLLYESK